MFGQWPPTPVLSNCSKEHLRGQEKRRDGKANPHRGLLKLNWTFGRLGRGTGLPMGKQLLNWRTCLGALGSRKSRLLHEP